MQLYIHIPYCKQKCRYCDFASYVNQEGTMEAYVDALLAEADAALPSDTLIDTIFIGGGTPSILPAHLLDKLLKGIRTQADVSSTAEITCEANPGTLTDDWLAIAAANDVNRISMGMQAPQPELLSRLGRIHKPQDVIASVALVRKHGIQNLNLDLMFGLPGQTPQMWQGSLNAALSLSPEHLSCYGLIPEDGTPLKHDLDAGRLFLPDEEDERRMYDDTLCILAQHGYKQYEISNFALPGYECRHNIGYWTQVPYVGLGASAASMLMDGAGERRTTNPPEIHSYLHMVQHQDWNMRTLDLVKPEDARFETLMLGLRMNDGVSESDFLSRHGITLEDYRGSRLQDLASRGLLLKDKGRWQLTRKGMDVQNAILVELMDD